MKSTACCRPGFTLIEMLVSISIVSFMLLMLAQITALTEQAWRLEQNRIDNFTKARSMLDLINDDLQRAVIRGDLPIFNTAEPNAAPTNTVNGLYYFTAPATTPSTPTFTTAFYTRIPGVPSTASTQVRDLSLVSYALLSTNSVDKVVLQRSDLAVPWSSSSAISFQTNMTTPSQSPGSFDVLAVAPGVVGFRLAFRQANGTMIDQSQYTGYNPSNPVVAIDVGIAVIGRESLSQLSATQITAIQNAFNASLPSTSNGIKASWDQNVLVPSFYSSYPQGFGGGIKTFERWVACTPF